MPLPTPRMEGIIHVALTVCDVESSVAWYERVLGFRRVGRADHEGGFGVVLCTADERVWVVLHHHDANEREPFSVTRTGLDHVAFQVATYDELEAWQEHFDRHDVRCSQIVTIEDFGVSALVFFDPDGIQLELIGPLHTADGGERGQ